MPQRLMKNVWYTCPFVPPEWISAHGLRPRRRLLSSSASLRAAGAPAGVCPYANAFVAAAASTPPDDAVIVTTLCDQMRRASELVERDAGEGLFVMHVPRTWRDPGAHRLYTDELRRLGRFLEGLGGQAPPSQRLREVMRAYDSARRGLVAAGGRLPARRFAQALADFQECGWVGASGPELPMKADPPTAVGGRGGTEVGGAASRPAVAIVGGPIMRDDFWIFDRVEEFGGRVVLNATVGAELSLPAPLDRRLGDDPLAELAGAYFGHVPHPARRPNSGLYQYLRREIRDRNVAGVLFVWYVWCDLWHAELHRLKEWALCPVTGLELTDDAGGAVRATARIQSLLEMLT